jgi:hypothetical protein
VEGHKDGVKKAVLVTRAEWRSHERSEQYCSLITSESQKRSEAGILKCWCDPIITISCSHSRFRPLDSVFSKELQLRTCDRREEFQARFSRDCTWFRRSKALHLGDRRLKVTRKELGPSGIEEPVNALLSDESHSVRVTG